MRTFRGGHLMVLAALVLTAAPPLSAQEPELPTRSAAEALRPGVEDGVLRADRVGTGGYVVTGFVGGFLLGPVGAGVMWAVANYSDTALPASEEAGLQGRDPAFVEGFRSGYSDRLKGKRKRAALTGGAIGTVFLLSVMLSFGDSP